MSKTILIADDEPHMLRLIELNLKRAGYRIVTAANGREALDTAAREHPDLIIMDGIMPEIDGLTALRQLKLAPATANTPIIMLSARGQTINREEAALCGAALYLTKPFSPSALASEALRLIGPP